MGKPCSCTQFIKSHIFYYKSRKNPYQYCKSHENLYQVLQVICVASEHAMKLKVCMIKIKLLSPQYLPSFPGPKEEKGSGFSRLRMCLIAVELYHLRILLVYLRTLMTPESILNITLSVDLWQQSMAWKKLTRLYSFSGRFEAINTQCELLWSRLTRRRGYLPAKPLQEVTWACITLPSSLSARDLH